MVKSRNDEGIRVRDAPVTHLARKKRIIYPSLSLTGEKFRFFLDVLQTDGIVIQMM